MPRRILFLVPYPLEHSPSQRFRFEQYFNLLQANGFEHCVQAFLNADNLQVFYQRNNSIGKLFALAKGLGKRVIALLKAPKYDFVFIHRELTPIGPPVFEWILAKVFRKKIIYDFDDAIWLTDRKEESFILALSKWRMKVGSICRWSYKVSCGNDYLCGYASSFNENIIYNPTTIDTELLHNPVLYPHVKSDPGKIRIGWTGSHSTLKYLNDIEPVLTKILTDYPNAEFVVIADKQPTLSPLLPITFIPWNSATEIQDLSNFDIGIMPLPNDEWAKGKCGFKALQYMALEFPAVASPVGVNAKIINDGVNGFLCDTPLAWESALKKLIEDGNLRKKMGKRGRTTVVENYSVGSNISNFLSLFE